MTAIETKSLAEIEALMQERQKYERWIQLLEERRGVTAAHVYQRVLGDYHARMNEVSGLLSGRATEVESSIAALRERLAELQAEETRISDERAEAELRAAVGEYTTDKWEEVRRVADEQIAHLSASRAELGSELGHLEQILQVATARPVATDEGGSGQAGDGGHGTQISAPQPGPNATSASQPDVAVPEVAAAAAVKKPASGSFDELAFLSSVVETEIAQLPSQQADVPRTRPTPIPTPSASRIVRAPTPLITEPVRVSDDDGMRGREEARIASFDRKLSGSVPAYLKDVPKEVAKSLKCQECGTMNYPTEWYCERCGGELAAL